MFLGRVRNSGGHALVLQEIICLALLDLCPGIERLVGSMFVQVKFLQVIL